MNVCLALGARADIAPHAGLWQVVFKGTSSATAERDWTRDILSVPEGTDWGTQRRRELGPILAYKFGDPSYSSKVTSAIHGDQPHWFDYTQVAYGGYIYLEAGKTYKFRANIDDDAYIKITDAQTGVASVLINFSDNCLHTSDSYTVSRTGWHAIEIRLGNGYGGAGGNPGDSSASCGISSDNGATWQKILDPGDGSFLRVYNEYPFTVGSIRFEGTRLSCVLTEDGVRPESLAVYAYADTTDKGQTNETWASEFSLGTWQTGSSNFVAHISAFPESAKVVRFAAVPNGDWLRASWSGVLDVTAWTKESGGEPSIFDCALTSNDCATASFALNVLSQGAGSAAGYVLKQYGYADQDWGAVEIVKTDSDVVGCVAIAQDGLRPGSAYRFRFAVSNDLGKVVWTDSIVLTTTAESLGFMHGSAGLWQVRFSNANTDWTKDILSVDIGMNWQTQRRRELGPLQAYTTRSQRYTSEAWGDQIYWINEDNNQWAYTGYIYLDAAKTYKFRSKIDDNELLKITDLGTGATTTLISDTSSGSGVITSASYTPSVTGYHKIEVRFSDGSGGAGGYDSSSSYKNTYNLGYSEDNGSNWKLMIDPGNGSFLCVGKSEDIAYGTTAYDGASLATVLTRTVSDGAYAPEAKVYAVYGANYHADDLAAWGTENKVLIGTWREGEATFAPCIEGLSVDLRYVRFAVVATDDSNGILWTPTILLKELATNVGSQPQFGSVEYVSNSCASATFDVQILTRGADATAATLSATYSYMGEHGFEETTVLLAGAEVIGTRSVTLTGLKPNASYTVRFTVTNDKGESIVSDAHAFATVAEAFGNIAAFPGLWQARFVEANGDWSKNIWDVAEGTDWQNQRRRELGPIQAYATRTQQYTSELWKDAIYWIDQNENQWAYDGYIYLEKDKSYKFRAKIDDNEKIAITDCATGLTTVLVDDLASSSDVITSAAYSPSVTGWHHIEVRLSDGYGGAGGYDSSSNYKNTNNLGFSSDGGSTWQFLVDPGDGSLLLPERPDAVLVQETVFDGATLNAVLHRNEKAFVETASARVYAVFDTDYHGDVLSAWPEAQKISIGTWKGTDETFIAGVPGLKNMRYLRFVTTSANGTRLHWSDTVFLPETPKNATEYPVLYGASVTATNTASAAFHVDVLAQGTNTTSATLKFVYGYTDDKGVHCLTNTVASRANLTGTYDYEIAAIPAGTDYTAYFFVETDAGMITRYPVQEDLTFATWSACTILADSDSSSYVRYDARSTYPGKLVRGTVTIGDADGGEAMAWDTSALADGWNTVTKGANSDDLVVLNNPVVSIEGGRIEMNTEWTSNTTHLLRNVVYIPSGRTLTVSQGAVVKFCAGTGIKIEDGGTLNIVGADGADVIFTAANDDTVGEKVVGLPEGTISHKGVWRQTSSATLTDNNYVQMRGTAFGDYSTVYLNDTTAFRSSETAIIPVTIGGSNRSKPFSVDWVAKDGTAKFNEDYTLAAGRITWNQYSEGTKTISIPLVKDHIVGSNTTFTIEIVTNRAVNVGRQICTVTIKEWDTLNLQSAALESSAVRFDTRTNAPGRAAHGVEKITAGGNDDEAMGENWDTAVLEDGWTTLTRSTNSLEMLAINDAAISIEGGRITSNTMWTSNTTHLLRNIVYIPSGKTLTVTTNAVVKFMEGTGIKIEDGGKLNVIGADGGDVIFTAANDDTAGAVIPGMPEGTISHKGFWKQSSSANFSDNCWIETRNWGTGLYPEMWLNDTTAFRSIGTAYIPVTIGGSRDQSLSVDWRTVNGTAKYGEDFTANSGRVTWNKASEGTKIIQIPLVKDHLVGKTTSFTVEITVNRGVNVSRRTCTVEIRELDTIDFSSASATSTAVRYEDRDTFPGLLNTGSVNLGSPDGATVTAWDTTQEANGWVTVTSGETNKELAVINDKLITVEGGRLAANTTWTSNTTHLIRNTVYVPSGITLTLSEGAVVKYLQDTTIKIEDGGKLNVVGSEGHDVILTAANDDTAGAEIPAVDKETTISFSGIMKMSSGTYTDNMYVQTRGFSYGSYPTLTIHDAVVNRINGKVYIPVTVSGSTRNQSFNVDWQVVPDTAKYGTDYKTKSGTLTWSKSGDGAKQIEITLNTTPMTDERRSFTVKFVTARATNVADGEAVVTIHEYTDCGIKADVSLAESSASADFSVQESIKRQPIFRGETEQIRYDGQWQSRRDPKDTIVRISVESDNGITRLAEYPGNTVGAYTWKASDYNVGYYTLKHEIVSEETREVLDTVTKSFSIVDEDDVVLHGGTLTQNETWKAGKTHVVYETVVVPSVYTLFIEPGAIVKFMSGTGIDISQGGALFANAIIFTHIDDDTIGGDTLSDGYTVAPSMDSYSLSGNFTFGADTEIRYITQSSALTGTISDQRVLSRGSTYRVSGTVTVASGGSLTIPSGTVLKMESGAAIVVNGGGALYSKGTRAAPVIITSINDDSVSGKMDGSSSNPQPGDWTKITINGTGFFDFTKILYSSKNSTTGAINMNGGTTTFINGEIAHCAYDAVGVESGHFYMTNSVIADALLAFRHWPKDPIVNCVIYDCGRLTQGGGQTFVNCIFSRISETWEAFGFPQGTTYKNCCFWNEGGPILTGEGTQDAMTVCGKNGNIWGDPLFEDPDNYDFRIAADSPCVDAADTASAPAEDFYGQPRLTVRENAAGTAQGQLADMGICEVMLRGVTSDIDLEARSIRGETNAVPGKLVFIKWEVANIGGSPVAVEWRDTISLVSEDGSQEVTLGDKTTSSTIAIGGTAFCSAYFTVPAMSEGKWYPKVNVNSYHDIFEGTLTTNNVLVGATAIDVAVESLDVNEGDEGVLSGGSPKVLKMSFAEEDENRMVRITVPAGVTVRWGFGFMPGTSRYSGTATASGADILFKVPDGTTDVYLSLDSDETVEYEVQTESGKVAITSVSPNTLPSSGEVTITIDGAGFTSDSAVYLVNGGTQITPESVQYVSAQQLVATVDCAKLTAGAQYDVSVVGTENTATASGAVSVAAVKGEGKFWAKLVVPESVRQGRVVTCYVEYGNSGNVDVASPILQIVNKGNGTLGYADGRQGLQVLEFVAIGSSVHAGVLIPGEQKRKTFLLSAGSSNGLVLSSSSTSSNWPAPWASKSEFEKCLANAVDRLSNRGGDASDSLLAINLARALYTNGLVTAVSGKISTSTGVNLEGLIVECESVEDHTCTVSTTDENGAYSICVNKGQYSVTVVGLNVSSKTVECNGIADVRCDFQIESKWYTDVYIPNIDNTSPTVTAHGSNVVHYASSIGNNTYRFFNLETNQVYEIKVVAGTMMGVMCIIPDDKDIVIPIDLSEVVTVRGCLHNLDEAKISDDVISVRIVGESGYEATAVPDKDGNFNFQQVPTGDYSFVISGVKHLYALQDNYSISGDISPFDFYLVPDAKTLSGTVVGLGNGSVALLQGSAYFASMNYAEDGNFLFTGVADGRYVIAVYDGQNELQYLSEITVSDGNRVVDIVIPVLTFSSLQKSIFDDNVLLNSVHSAKLSASTLEKDWFTRWFESEARLKSYELWEEFSTYWTRHTPRPPPEKYACAENMETYHDDLASWTSFVPYINDLSRLSADCSRMEKIALGSKLAMDTASLLSDISFSGAKITESIYGISTAILSGAMTAAEVAELEGFKADLQEIESICASVVNSSIDFGMAAYVLQHKVRKIARNYNKLYYTFKNKPVFKCLKVLGICNDIVSTVLDICAYYEADKKYDDAVDRWNAEYQNFKDRFEWFKVVALGYGCYHKCDAEGEDDLLIYVPPLDQRDMDTPTSNDPNEMGGIMGRGDSGTQRYVKPGEWMTYTVYFENKSTATAAAQEVKVTNPLSKYLDWSTFEMGEVAFNNQIDLGLSGKQNGTSEVALNGTSYQVRSKVTLDKTDGKVDWYLRIVDPTTATTWPDDVFAGLLPPNDSTYRGEGHLTYRIKVRDDVPVDTKITNAASIIFDYNDPIETEPAWWNLVGEFNMMSVDCGNGETNTLDLVANVPFGTLPTPKKKGYKFLGWFFGPNGTGGEVTADTVVPSGLKNIYPQWDEDIVYLTVDGECADYLRDDEVAVATFDAVTNGWTNLVCKGWIGTGDVPATGASNEVSLVLTQDSELWWHYQTNYWVAVDANVSFASGEDDAIETIASTCAGGRVTLKDAAGATITNELWSVAGTNLTAEATANEGWLFAGWREVDPWTRLSQSRQEGVTVSTSDVIGTIAATCMFDVQVPIFLEAVFTQKVFAVMFDLGEHGTRSGGGELVQTVKWGKAAAAPTVSARAGYTFTKWDVAFDNVKSALKVTAQYSIDTYAIAYVEPMGCDNTNPTSYTVEDAITFSALTNPPGWKFLGWSPASIAKGTMGDKTVTAQWEQIKYRVDIGGVVDNTCTNGQIVTAETFAAVTNGYTNIVCVGWVGTGDVPASGTGNKVSFTVTQESSLTWLYATNYWVSVGCGARGGLIEAALPACAGGVVAVKDAAGATITNELWSAAGTNLTAEATANEGWLFAGWREVDPWTRLSQSRQEGVTVSTSDVIGTIAATCMFDVQVPIFLEAVFTQKVFAVTFDLGEHGTRSGGGELTQTIEWGQAATAPTVSAKAGYAFAGWDFAFDNVKSNLTVTAQWRFLGVFFMQPQHEVVEGDLITLIVSGGNAEKASSVVVYLAYQTAAAGDLDLAKASLDGVTPKGGVKFPLTLSWAAGEIGTKTISIPVKTDKTIEDDETLVFQLAAAQGQELGEVTTCAVTIRDANVAADYAAKQAKETVKTKKGVADNYPLTVACVAGDGSGDVCGYTTGQGKYYKGCKATLKATARPGWEFKGWYAVTNAAGGASGHAGRVTLPDDALVSRLVSLNLTLTNDAEIVALFGRIPYVAGLATPADGGKVAGSGYCAAGKKVSLKATANKNYTFTGWVRADDSTAVDSGRLQATAVDGDLTPILTPTLVFDRSAKPAKSDAKQTVITNASESVSYYATFKSDPEIFVTAACDDAKGAALTGKGTGKFVAGTVTGAGKYAAGKKKITLKATANKGYVFMGWYPVDAIETIASTCLSRLASYTIAEMPTNDVSLTAAFITSGLDKSNIVATVNGAALEPWVSKTETHAFETNIWTGVYLEWPVAASALSATTVKVAGLPGGLKFTDKPVTTKMTTGSGKTKVTTIVTNIAANTIYGAPTAASKTSTDRKTGAVTVTPSQVKVTVTTAGKNSQTYQIDAIVDPLPGWVVGTFAGPSYSDAIETIASTCAGDGAYTNGTVAVTIGANGKISAKQPVNGKSTSFAASYFDSYAETDDFGPAFHATLTAKVGNEVVTNKMAVARQCGRDCLNRVGDGTSQSSSDAFETNASTDYASATNGYIEADLFDAWQYNWKIEPWKSVAKEIVAAYPKATTAYYILADGTCVDEADDEGMTALVGTAVGDGTPTLPLDGTNVTGKVTLKFAASGAVTVSGEFVQLDAAGNPVYKNKKLQIVKATGSSTLVPMWTRLSQSRQDEGDVPSSDAFGTNASTCVFIYLAPKGFSPHVRCVEVR